MADLVVELYGTQVGVLTGPWRTFDFVTDPAAVNSFGLDSTILSAAIPLTVVRIRARKDRRQNFFRELLPEARMLSRLAQQAGVSELDVIGLLRWYGRDVAGALQIWDPDVPGEPRQPALEPLSSAGVADMLNHVQRDPLGNRPATGKTSLAGVQDKIVLALTDNGWNRVIDGWPSTHILKPRSHDYPTTIYDEEFGARIARALELTAYSTWIEEFEGTPALVIERYDRSPDAPQGRIHQEDFNQVLGTTGNEKYQKYGGRVSLERIARIFSSVGDDDSLRRLFTLVVVSVAIGNLDLHAKNISLVHRPDGSMTLSPAYDLVPQAHLPNDGEVALAVAGEYRHAALTLEHLTGEGHAWGLASAGELAEETLTTVLDLARTQSPYPEAQPSLDKDITRFASNLLSGRTIGGN
ncbi:HipA domain-containing protein [Frankia sp. AgB1.9]|uniref:type II toxin-antitoxin system HipA family toxin n=1 Tax=unclassified Frankia TaxID=2632575 RepID=UPI0019335BF6|nr:MULTISPECIES: HipA domain-containing protein [unclassified Frankia]MBL7490058.1 HipA domain-containing protein [Frankia sp. AgW1.1]MBL7551907.1 HipA domain-containing protein [Frankia sp. AgB1.9]MBL7624048.1 HipA domain-containing protein [Frankia sp. AgB1.8]